MSASIRTTAHAALAAALLAIGALAERPASSSADPLPSTGRIGALPAELRRLTEPLGSGDPFALADPRLPRLSQLDSAGRAILEDRLAGWSVDHRVAAWAFLQVGTPYRLGPLGEGAPPDTDPVLEFATTDCAVLNLTSAALAHARDAGGERAALARANYRDGRIAYDARFHFTTDRLDHSPYYHDVSHEVAGSACRSQIVLLNRRSSGGRWIDIDWTGRRRVWYVPRALAGRFPEWHDRGRIPDALGVAFVKRSSMSDGLDVVHESMLWRGRTLLHASSLTGRVVTLPWSTYLAGPGRGFDGFVLFEYR